MTCLFIYFNNFSIIGTFLYFLKKIYRMANINNNKTDFSNLITMIEEAYFREEQNKLKTSGTAQEKLPFATEFRLSFATVYC